MPEDKGPQWQPDEWGIQEEHQITAPEAQAGMGYSIRYLMPRNAEGYVPMITVGFYCEDRWQLAGAQSDGSDLCLTDPPPAEERYTIGQVVTYDLRRDPADEGVGDWSSIDHRSFWFSQAEPFTDAEIRSIMEHFDNDRELICWRGDTDDRALAFGAYPIDPPDWENYVLPAELWKRIDAAIWLRETFQFELCAECLLDADGHTVGPGPFGHWHAFCKISDPHFALKVARESAEKGDTTKAANGFSEEDLRNKRFEAAIHGLADALDSGNTVTNSSPLKRALDYRSWAVADDPEMSEFGKRKLVEELDYIAGWIERVNDNG